ncbi:ABC transporter substrate-binding protein [Hirschia litorea]|uniref:ABC transporter substrate-binding protein n=1 Tax=Hirschia litorea TaxID=1199156 RepID=A0ABW2IHK1_9PROT
MSDITDRPMRIVSLDFCSDQYVLKLVDRDRILGVSPDAKKQFSYMRDTADGIASIKPIAEDVILKKPDLVVRSYGGGPNAAHFFEQAGIPVLNVGWANDLDGVKRVISEMSAGLGESEKGNQIIAQMDDRLNAIQSSSGDVTALYMTPTGVTSGAGSLVHEMLLAAGLTNFQDLPGWRSLPLERLAYEQPDIIAAAFFESKTNHKDAWSAMRHPVAKEQMIEQPTVMLQGAWTACGSWFLLDAIEALASAKYESITPDDN